MAGTESAFSLDIYKVQLQQVNEALKRESDESSIKDLKQLRDDLIQLISLTDENFQGENSTSTGKESDKSFQKEEPTVSNLQVKPEEEFADELSDFYSDIAQIENLQATEGVSDVKKEKTFDEEVGNFYSEMKDPPDTSSGELKRQDSSALKRLLSNSANEEFLDSIENLEDISGFKCQAPFSTEWAGIQYHNAMIKGVIDKEMSEEESDIRVKVLFLNPTMKVMQPCPYYLEGNCKFDAPQCRYSHGHVVSLYDLQPYIMPDYTNLKEGSKCIAKMEDGLWKPGLVDKIEDQFYQIKFLHKDFNLLLELCDLLPQIDHAEEEGKLSDGDDDIVTEIVPTANIYSKYGESSSAFEDKPSIGLWEEHTKGIGLKLLQKMGYKVGEGLGRLAQGRLEPVPIVVLPPGKSLDHCMKIREEKGVKKINDGVQSLERGRSNRKRQKHGVFSFLNKTLGDKLKNPAKKEILKTKDMFGIKEGKDKKSTKNFNKEMFKNDEEMRRIKGKIQKVQESLRRNQGNPAVTKSLRSKLEELKRQLSDMKEYDSNIKIHKSRVETHRKMTVF